MCLDGSFSVIIQLSTVLALKEKGLLVLLYLYDPVSSFISANSTFYMLASTFLYMLAVAFCPPLYYCYSSPGLSLRVAIQTQRTEEGGYGATKQISKEISIRSLL
jgi:hypothetical protein